MGHVYLIGTPKHNWYKIGKSANATIRISELGILLPFRIDVIAVWKTDSYHELEKELHREFADYRINGEWFLLDNRQVRRLVIDMQAFSCQIGIGFTNIEYVHSLKERQGREKQKKTLCFSLEEMERRKQEGILLGRQKKAAREAGLDLRTIEQAKVLAKI